MKLKYLLGAILLACPFASFAQVETEVEASDDAVFVDNIEMTEGMIISAEEMWDDYFNDAYLSEGTGTAEVLSYDNDILADRLSRIPTTIDMPLNDITRKYIDMYSNRMRRSVSVMLGASNYYMPIFEDALERYQLPLELKYLPVIESALKPGATSGAGAAGLWQFIVGTGKRFGLEINTLVDDRRDPIKSSEAAAKYFKFLYEKFGDWSLCIAAYNCGEGNVQKAMVRSGNKENGKANFWDIYDYLPKETRGYVPAFIAATYIMNYYCVHGIVPMSATLPEESDTVQVAREISFSQITRYCDVSIDQLRILNPQYRKDIIPRGYTLRLPMNEIIAFVENEKKLYSR